MLSEITRLPMTNMELSNLQININLSISTGLEFMVILEEDLCQLLQSFPIPIFTKLLFHPQEIMIIIYNQWWGETHNGVTEIEKKIAKKEEVKDSLNKKNEVEISFKGAVEKNQDIAKNLKGYLLLVTGDIDDNVHPGNTLRVVDALIKANKRFDFMMLPGQKHAYGNDIPYFDRLMWYYFAEHLLGDYRTNVDLLDF